MLQYLLTQHEEVAADRIPTILQVLRRLVAATAARSDQRRNAPDHVMDRVSFLFSFFTFGPHQVTVTVRC